MSLFKGGDVIDLTDLQKRGILKKSAEIAGRNEKNWGASGDFIDLTKNQSSGIH